VLAALNVTVHAADTPVEVLTGEYLPLLLRAAADISNDWQLLDTVPISTTAGHKPSLLA
jgi:IclR family pca regulon transcriptional regulator